MLCREGSSDRQQSQHIPTPYDKWTDTLEKGLPNDKQVDPLNK